MRLFAAAAMTLLLCARAAPARAITPDQQRRLDGWPGVKAKAARLKERFLAAVQQDPSYDFATFEKGIDESWQLCQSVEDKARAEHAGKLDELAAKRPQLGEDAYWAKREALTQLFQQRMLFTYGGMFPRILDEAVTDDSGKQIGRSLAGPEWSVDLEQQEHDALEDELRPLTAD